MVGLRELVFTDNLITDVGLIPIGTLPNLRTLDLSRNNITDAGLDCLFSLARLEHLRLLGIPLTEADLAAIVPLPRLREVSLNSVKSRQHRKAIAGLFRERREVEVTWPGDDEIFTWVLYDNRPGRTTGDGFGIGSGILPLSGEGN